MTGESSTDGLVEDGGPGYRWIQWKGKYYLSPCPQRSGRVKGRDKKCQCEKDNFNTSSRVLKVREKRSHIGMVTQKREAIVDSVVREGPGTTATAVATAQQPGGALFRWLRTDEVNNSVQREGRGQVVNSTAAPGRSGQ